MLHQTVNNVSYYLRRLFLYQITMHSRFIRPGVASIFVNDHRTVFDSIPGPVSLDCHQYGRLIPTWSSVFILRIEWNANAEYIFDRAIPDLNIMNKWQSCLDPEADLHTAE